MSKNLTEKCWSERNLPSENKKNLWTLNCDFNWNQFSKWLPDQAKLSSLKSIWNTSLSNIAFIEVLLSYLFVMVSYTTLLDVIELLKSVLYIALLEVFFQTFSLIIGHMIQIDIVSDFKKVLSAWINFQKYYILGINLIIWKC